MASEKDFYEQARRALSLHDRLEGLKSEGKVDADKYGRERAALDAMLAKLKVRNVELLGGKIAETEKSMRELELKRAGGGLEIEDYHSLKRVLTLKRNEMESELDMVQISGGWEYAECIRRELEEKKYERYWGTAEDYRVFFGRRKPKDEDSIPFWAFFAALVLVAGGFFIGVMSGSAQFVILLPMLAAFYIVSWTLILHSCALLVGFAKASLSKAFKSVMLNLIFMLVAGTIILLVFANIIRPGMPGIGNPMDSRMSFLSTVPLATLVFTAFVVPVFSVYVTYGGPAWRSVAAVLLTYVVTILLQVILAAFVADRMRMPF
jgi:hypothetical protein